MGHTLLAGILLGVFVPAVSADTWAMAPPPDHWVFGLSSERQVRVVSIAVQACDHLLALDPEAGEPKVIKADALEAIARNVLSGIGRSYNLSVVQELGQNAEPDAPADADKPRR